MNKFIYLILIAIGIYFVANVALPFAPEIQVLKMIEAFVGFIWIYLTVYFLEKKK
jgi:hypothetical protein